MAELSRLTTEYVEAEDRFRFSGVAGEGSPVVLWLTQRLMLRLLPPLLEWLEKQGGDLPRAEVLNAFAQQKAQLQMEPQAPVRAHVESPHWLVASIDLVRGAQGVRLTLKGTADQSVTLTMNNSLLRQWLAIVHGGFRRSGWPMAVWPEWMAVEQKPTDSGRPVLLH